MEFLTNKQIKLNAAGYLVSAESKQPITHKAFVEQQKSAEYLVKLSTAIKDCNFKEGKVDSLESIKQEVRNAINAANTTSYLSEPTEPKSKVQDELLKFALDFDKFHDDKDRVQTINRIMQQFNSINDVETVGEYFEQGLVKLSKIYTIAEILEAATIQVDKLD